MNALRYIPSIVEFEYDTTYTALTNESGRMQYYKVSKGRNRIRITRNEFLDAYNKSKIIAVKPIQEKEDPSHLRMDFFIKDGS